MSGEIAYQAKTWQRLRRVPVKAEHLVGGASPRHVMTSPEGDPQELHDRVYCARGEMEQQSDLFADRASCSPRWPNRYRMLLGGLAHVLPEQVRRNGLYGTRLARAHVGAVIVRNTRRVVFMLSGSLSVPGPVPPRGTAGALMATTLAP